ncbi:MAG: polyphosphate kinase 1 [Gemmatimonadetes bacterium]|nr:polyphosphate kinase 1 [Gemmatimonadota bacterium]
MISSALRSSIGKVTLYYLLLAVTGLVLVAVLPQFGSVLSDAAAPAGLREFADSIGVDPSTLMRDQAAGAIGTAGRTLLVMLGALLLSVPIAWVYMLTKQELAYDEAVVHTVIILPIAVAGIAMVIQESVALAFSLAGVVAAVRFRNTLKDTKDAVYIFLAIGVGLAAGVGALVVAFIMSVIFNLTVLALWRFNIGDLYAFRSATGVAAPGALPAAVGVVAPPAAPVAGPDRRRGSMIIDTALLSEIGTGSAGGLEPVINPEISVLEFNTRVLALAEDPAVPLLARLRFLSIVSSNLDEFVMIKVGGLKHAVAAGITKQSMDGKTPRELLNTLHVRLRALTSRQYRCFNELRNGDLRERGIRILAWDDLNDVERKFVADHFDEHVFPVLTPKAVTTAPGHPLPRIDELRLSLAILVRDARSGRDHFAILNVSDALPRFVRIGDTLDFIPIEDAIRANAGVLYPGRQVQEVHAFRLSRSGEIQVDEQAAANFLEVVEEEVLRRPHGAILRVEVERSMPDVVRDLLFRDLRREENREGIALDPSDVFESDGMVDLHALEELADLPLADLHYPSFVPTSPLEPDRSIFDQIDERDLLVHHPYESFNHTVQRLIVDAADDPDVVSIKMTLYRAGGRSLIVEALRRAAAAGKDVAVFVEIKARFDEEMNIYWAKQLERAGIHVVTGLVSLKTHAKVALVVRKQGDKIRRYAHVGTGNYNAGTARQYADLGLLTADPAVCTDLNALFNELTGSSRAPTGNFQRLIVAPTYMLSRFLELIEREIQHARAGRGGHIRAKLNGIADAEVIEALYKASQAGVRIELIVRGICSLRPGVPGMSDNIKVVSLVGRFLEHARIFYFANGGEPEYFIGSADWRSRNLRRRVEVVAPVVDPAARARLEAILEAELSDPHAWLLQGDGSSIRATQGEPGPSAQEQFLQAIEVAAR